VSLSVIEFQVFARHEAHMRVINGIPLGCPLPLTVTTVYCIQTLKVEDIRSHLQELRAKRKDLLVMMRDVQCNAEMILSLHTRESDRSLAQLDDLRGEIEIDLDNQKQRKLARVMQTKGVLSEQTRQLEQILLSVDEQLQSRVQCELVRRSGELIERCNNIRCTPMGELVRCALLTGIYT
jgi:hypothetical protein